MPRRSYKNRKYLDKAKRVSRPGKRPKLAAPYDDPIRLSPTGRWASRNPALWGEPDFALGPFYGEFKTIPRTPEQHRAYAEAMRLCNPQLDLYRMAAQGHGRSYATAHEALSIMEQPDMSIIYHDELPAYFTEEIGVWIDQDPKILRWSGKARPPAIGEKVQIDVNNLGTGTVVRYFAQEGWLGVLVQLDHISAERHERWGGGPTHVFGAELK